MGLSICLSVFLCQLEKCKKKYDSFFAWGLCAVSKRKLKASDCKVVVIKHHWKISIYFRSGNYTQFTKIYKKNQSVCTSSELKSYYIVVSVNFVHCNKHLPEKKSSKEIKFIEYIIMLYVNKKNQ